MKLRRSKLSGSDRQRIEDIYRGQRRFSPSQLAKRATRRERRYAGQ